jgi:hypothetical protein
MMNFGRSPAFAGVEEGEIVAPESALAVIVNVFVCEEAESLSSTFVMQPMLSTRAEDRRKKKILRMMCTWHLQENN